MDGKFMCKNGMFLIDSKILVCKTTNVAVRFYKKILAKTDYIHTVTLSL